MSFLKKIRIESKTKVSKEGSQEVKEKKWFGAEGKLTVDVYETNSNIVIQAAIAGVKTEDFDISIENDMLEIRGVRKKPEEDKDVKNYFFQECWWGPFSRKIILPKEVDNSRTQASMKEGILTIRIPKLERERKRRIRLKTKKGESK